MQNCQVPVVNEKLQTLPKTPGVYLFKDTHGGMLYVGKAKSLRSRVRSYFRPEAQLDAFKQQMVKEITDIETITTDNETEALVLEANLINKHQPPYNVILRDDKYYLFIKITKEEFPRVFLTRRLKADGARYFGPYSSARTVRATLNLLRRLFPFRGEKDTPHDRVFPHPLFAQRAKSAPRRALPKPTAKEGSFSEGGQPTQDPPQQSTKKSYLQNITNIIRFLKGEREEIIATLHQGMEQASRAHHYERAATFRDQLRATEHLEGEQKVYLPRRESFDIISVASRGTVSAANVFSIRRGKLLGKNTFLLRHRSTTTPPDILRQFILQYYRVAQDIPNTVLIPHRLSDQNVLSRWINPAHPPDLHVPQRGKKHQLLKLGERNAEQQVAEQEITFMQDTRLKTATSSLAQAIGLPAQPLKRIETYDVSNIQGQLATASMVVFIDGKPAPSLYRKFRLRLAGKPNDTAMMKEVLSRRFSNRHPDWPKPDLILIDGGRGQLTAATAVLDSLGLAIPTAALAKREEELFVPEQTKPIRLPYDSDTLYLLQRMRDEAHRFTLAYHRLLRTHRQQRSLLDDVPGIGPKTKRKLLHRFGSLKAIRAAGTEELTRVIGQAKAKMVQEYL